jgi:hypothetical protein
MQLALQTTTDGEISLGRNASQIGGVETIELDHMVTGSKFVTDPLPSFPHLGDFRFLCFCNQSSMGLSSFSWEENISLCDSGWWYATGSFIHAVWSQLSPHFSGFG